MTVMMPLAVKEQAAVPPPSFQRAQTRRGPALHINALTLVTTLHLLALCRLAVRLAHRRCPPHYLLAKEEDHGAIVKRVYCSSVCCGPCGAYRTKTCMTGSRVGLWLAFG